MNRNTLSPPFFPCPWASAWGEDRYGLWQMLKLGEVEQVFRWIEPGTFMMGRSEDEYAPRIGLEEWLGLETQHLVTLSGFWLADTTVTQALWMEVMDGDNPSEFQDNRNNPVENVSWDDAQRFIEALNVKVKGLAAQLPSEAQWEYACRAGTRTVRSFGNSIDSVLVNYNPSSIWEKGLYREKTVPVKSLPANPWGLYEMHGNVWELCWDAWQEDLGTSSAVDPLTLAAKEDGHVMRGGSWNIASEYIRSSIRFHNRPSTCNKYLGFRLSLGHSELWSRQICGAK